MIQVHQWNARHFELEGPDALWHMINTLLEGGFVMSVTSSRIILHMSVTSWRPNPEFNSYTGEAKEMTHLHQFASAYIDGKTDKDNLALCREMVTKTRNLSYRVLQFALLRYCGIMNPEALRAGLRLDEITDYWSAMDLAKECQCTLEEVLLQAA